MSWSYISNLDEYDKEVTKDTSTANRYTFNRYMYFKPDQYENWSKGQGINGIPYTAELVGNANIPSGGTYLSGSLSSFYVNNVISIRNLSEEEHGEHCSYAVVTIEYENRPKATSSSGSSSQNAPNKPPWDREVEDFTITNQEVSSPLTNAVRWPASIYGSNVEKVSTTAGQILYGFTKGEWIQRMTWSFNTRNNTNYSMRYPIINNADVTLFNKITIPKEFGLLLPPGYKKLYWSDDRWDYEPYHQWTFEIIVKPWSYALGGSLAGHTIPVINAGTQAMISGQLVDICSWYVYDPTSQQQPPQKEFNSFGKMMEEKKKVDEYNKSITDETKKKVWHGDYVQNPVPLDANGAIDYSAINNITDPIVKFYQPYDTGTWILGGV